MIIETHAHYDDEAFDADREELLRELPENGIGRVINVGASMQTTRNSIALAEKYPFIYAAVGVHPDDVAELDETAMEELRGYCRREITVAVGEIGLDYYWHKEPEHQKLQQMVGKKVMVLVNLKPAKLAGVLSEGMLLCAEDADGNLSLMTPEKEMPVGAEIC